ncbi:MAG: transcription antitermination factor NusB [Firmicutes bacterium HGW-Firmicutes-13]|nr:MAG: transcription antitermination factor NusB [Firmicutes bacterium HGW-Firmicutes-13]
MSRRLARELAFKILFQIDMGGNEPEQALQLMLKDANLSLRGESYVREKVWGCLNNLEYIDSIISGFLHRWELKRLSGVDRNLLRLAVFEMKYSKDIPLAVSINEAIELAKIYSGEESAKFINGILDNMVKNKSF